MKSPPGPKSSKMGPLAGSEAAAETLKTKRSQIAKRTVLLWENFETTKDPNVVRLGHVTQMAQPQA